MKVLLKEIKKHWIWLVILIIAHIIRAHTTLLLPLHTSGLVDTGIQNEGFEYAVPLAMTQEDYEEFESLLVEGEVTELQAAFEKDNQNQFTIDREILNDEEAILELESTLSYPMAIFHTLNQLSEEEQAEAFAIWDGVNQNDEGAVQEARSMMVTELEAFGDQYIHNAGVQASLGMFHRTGQDTRDIQFGYLFSNGGRMLGIAILSLLSAVVGFFLASRIAANVGKSLRSKLFNKVMDLSENEINEFSTASLITRTTNDVQQVTLVLTVFLRAMLFSPLLAIGGLTYIMQIQGSMTWILALMIALMIASIVILFILTMPKYKIVQKLFDKVNLIAREILTGLQVIRAFGRQDYERVRFDEANADLRDNHLFTSRTMSLMLPFMLLILDASAVLIVWNASGQISIGEMQVGQMMAFISYSMQVLMSFLMFGSMSIMMPRAFVAMDRIAEVINKPISIRNKEEVVAIDRPQGLVEFNDVSFAFEDADQPTVKNISFTARPGQTTAIIGSTGSGKSTLLNLLLRFYDVTEGSITIDGVDLRDLALEQIYDLVGYVPQKGVLFSGTIKSNIGYGVQGIDKSQLKRAADIAHATEFISGKNDGYDSVISQGGSNVSGGQKQRLSIARAIAKDPSIYVFDDSFSALDYRTDASLRQALSEEVSDATVIIVAQRISTIIDAEQIIVLNEGEIDGIGTHAELMKVSDVYREIAESQLSATELEARAEQDKGNLNLGWEG